MRFRRHHFLVHKKENFTGVVQKYLLYVELLVLCRAGNFLEVRLMVLQKKKVMGILRNGIFGGFVQRTGPLVGRRVNGQNVISMIKHPAEKPFTKAQQDQQLKMAMLASFLKKCKSLVDIGFAGAKRYGNAFNAATAYNLKNAVKGSAPDYMINYEKFLFSRGKLNGPNTPVMTALSEDRLVFSWLPIAQNEFNRYTDMACFMVYSEAKKMMICAVKVASRSDLSYVLLLPKGFIANERHCYMCFVSADGKVVSNSVYLGLI